MSQRSTRFNPCHSLFPSIILRLRLFRACRSTSEGAPDIAQRAQENPAGASHESGEGHNEFAVDAYDREQAIPKFDKPAVIRGFHYLDEGMARAIGGIKHCLKAPAWRVEKFCEGVLIELVPGLFDNYNPEHLRVQEEVMDYFDLL